VFEFIQRFFGKPASSATAKERLRLVLLSDHLSLAPDVVEALKHDLIEVISRYVDVDAMNCDVTFEQQEKQVAMLANIPILGMRSRPKPPAPPSPSPPRGPVPEPAPASSLDAGAAASVAEPPPAATPAVTPAVTPDLTESTAAAAVEGGGKKPSRRRRRKAVSTNTAPQAT
jgi:cell division topological specificity factor